MDNFNIKRKELENIYGKISPFEFKNMLIHQQLNLNKKAHVRY